MIRHNLRLSILDIGVARLLLELLVVLLGLTRVKLALIGGLKYISLIISISRLKCLLLPSLLL